MAENSGIIYPTAFIIFCLILWDTFYGSGFVLSSIIGNRNANIYVFIFNNFSLGVFVCSFYIPYIISPNHTPLQMDPLNGHISPWTIFESLKKLDIFFCLIIPPLTPLIPLGGLISEIWSDMLTVAVGLGVR